jgi:hypothetical protein
VDQNSTQIYGKTTFDREYPRSVRTEGASSAFCNSPVHEQWLLHVAVLMGRCSPALAAIVIALILQSQKLTTLCWWAVYQFCWCANYSTTPEAERSIQQSNRQVPMKQFVMFQRLLPSQFLHQVNASSNFFGCCCILILESGK